MLDCYLISMQTFYWNVLADVPHPPINVPSWADAGPIKKSQESQINTRIQISAVLSHVSEPTSKNHNTINKMLFFYD